MKEIYISKKNQHLKLSERIKIEIDLKTGKSIRKILTSANVGDIEADTVISLRGGKSCLAIFVDRKIAIIGWLK